MARTTTRRNRPSRQQIEQEALCNAKADRSMANYPAIIEGFLEKGISVDAIVPRENVFTYNAWRAQGRQVRKGEHGVKIVTWIDGAKKAEEGQEGESFKFARNVTVFHISQTDAIQANA